MLTGLPIKVYWVHKKWESDMTREGKLIKAQTLSYVKRLFPLSYHDILIFEPIYTGSSKECSKFIRRAQAPDSKMVR